MKWVCVIDQPAILPSPYGVYWDALWVMQDSGVGSEAQWIVLSVGGKYYATPNHGKYLGGDEIPDIGPFDTLEEAQEIAYTTTMLTCRPEDFL